MSVQYTDKSAAFLEKLEAAADVAVGYAAERLVQGIQDTMPGQGASKVGVGKDAVYTPSNVGTGPGVRDTRLKNSIMSVKTGKKMQRAVGTDVKYARIHEKGGIINHPGGTDYIVTDDGPRFVTKEKAVELRLKGKWVGKTGPHQITMPQRPFMSPGLNASKKSMLSAFKSSMGRAFK